jgi:hypothetical protein
MKLSARNTFVIAITAVLASLDKTNIGGRLRSTSPILQVRAQAIVTAKSSTQSVVEI